MIKEKKDKNQKIVNKLIQQKKKNVTGCLISKINPEDYESCLKDADNESGKYASSL